MINVPHAFTPEYPADETTSRPCKVPVILNVYDGYMFGSTGFDLAIDVEEAFDKVAEMGWQHQSQITEWLPWVGRHDMQAPRTLEEWTQGPAGPLRAQEPRAGDRERPGDRSVHRDRMGRGADDRPAPAVTCRRSSPNVPTFTASGSASTGGDRRERFAFSDEGKERAMLAAHAEGLQDVGIRPANGDEENRPRHGFRSVQRGFSRGRDAAGIFAAGAADRPPVRFAAAAGAEASTPPVPAAVPPGHRVAERQQREAAGHQDHPVGQSSCRGEIPEADPDDPDDEAGQEDRRDAEFGLGVDFRGLLEAARAEVRPHRHAALGARGGRRRAGQVVATPRAPPVLAEDAAEAPPDAGVDVRAPQSHAQEQPGDRPRR